MADELDLTIVIMRFEAADRAALEAVLATYVVSSRGHAGCRNIDLSGSETHPGRYVIVEKWDSPEAQRAHFDTDDMVKMAEACKELLSGPPDIDLLAPVSAHDLW
ncbi:MAG: putative quinol monooxygenase [Acidimicrobiales bacterium]